jgi:hypothetical protein
MRALLLDYAFRDEWIHRRSADSKAAWFKVVASAVVPRVRDSISASIFQSASLSLCSYTPPLSGLPPYLDDRSILPSSRLLTGARLGHLMVMVTVGRLLGWPKERAQCVLCQGGLEYVTHFLRDCVFLRPCRARFLRGLQSSLPALRARGSLRLCRSFVTVQLTCARCCCWLFCV